MTWTLCGLRTTIVWYCVIQPWLYGHLFESIIIHNLAVVGWWQVMATYSGLIQYLTCNHLINYYKIVYNHIIIKMIQLFFPIVCFSEHNFCWVVLMVTSIPKVSKCGSIYFVKLEIIQTLSLNIKIQERIQVTPSYGWISNSVLSDI